MFSSRRIPPLRPVLRLAHLQRLVPLLVLAVFLLAGGCRGLQVPPSAHPDTSRDDWAPLFAPDLANAMDPGGVWSVENGVLTATEDQELWTDRGYDDYILDLEFRNAEGTNSGVIIHASDVDDWIPNSLEIQIADDYASQWAEAPPHWQAGAVFGHQAPTQSAVPPPGEWNRLTITTRGSMVWILLNGQQVNALDMREFTSATTNPDGSEIPEWLSRPVAEIPPNGHIGLQGKHGDAPIWFRNVRIREIE